MVDNGTRKRMEEMLKTWKQPVTGSMDTRPVFSIDLVRPIENALMKAKAAMMPQTQGHLPGRPRSSVPPHRETPTPPGVRMGTPGTNQYANGGQPSGNPYHGQYNHVSRPSPPPLLSTGADMLTSRPLQPHSQQTTPQPTAPFQPPQANPYGSFAAPGNGVDTLNNDIHNLIAAVRAEVAQNPLDASLHTRLGALMDLQRIVQSTSLPPDQLELIRKQVTDLASVTLRASSAAAAQKPTPPPTTFTLPHQAQAPSAASPPVAPISAPAAASAVSLDSLLGAGAMAALMARQGSQNSTPQPPSFANAAIRSPQPAAAEPYRANPPPQTYAQSQPQPQAASSLLDQLRAAGLLSSATPQSAPPAAAPAPAPLATPTIPLNIASLLSSGALASALAKVTKPTSGLTSASLKQP